MQVRAAEVEADFQRYYNIHLGDLFTGDLTVRRFAVLFWALPPGATTWRHQGGSHAWSPETTAAMYVVHAVQQFQVSLSQKKQKVPAPEPPEWGHLEKEASRLEVTERRMRRHLSRVGPAGG